MSRPAPCAAVVVLHARAFVAVHQQLRWVPWGRRVYFCTAPRAGFYGTFKLRGEGR